MLGLLVAMGIGTGQASAASITYQILDLVPGGGAATSATFNGTGFAGMHSTSFSEFFMYETFNGGAVHSRTTLQVDISALAGATISSATLSYVLTSGSAAVGELALTSWDSSGTLTYTFPNPPNVISTTSYFPVGLSANSLNVTAQLAERVAAGDNWFGLYFAMVTEGVFHWTDTGGDADAALVRLDVNFQAVPEPATLTLVGVGAGVAAIRRLRRRRTVA
jgi:hypothetical protein